MQAAELNPGRLIHRVELARTALRLGQTSLAARELLVMLQASLYRGMFHIELQSVHLLIHIAVTTASTFPTD